MRLLKKQKREISNLVVVKYLLVAVNQIDSARTVNINGA